jgi:hypothetical protein
MPGNASPSASAWKKFFWYMFESGQCKTMVKVSFYESDLLYTNGLENGLYTICFYINAILNLIRKAELSTRVFQPSPWSSF